MQVKNWKIRLNYVNWTEPVAEFIGCVLKNTKTKYEWEKKLKCLRSWSYNLKSILRKFREND